MSNSSANLGRAPALLVGAKGGKGIYAARLCGVRRSRSSGSSMDGSLAVCDCPPAIYGAPKQYVLRVPPLTNGTCKLCEAMGGEMLLTYIGSVDGYCTWRSAVQTDACDGSTWYWYLKQNNSVAKITNDGMIPAPEWEGPNRYHGAVTGHLSTGTDRCIVPTTLTAFPVRDVTAGLCKELGEFYEGVLVGAKSGKAVFAAGPCSFAQRSSVSSGMANAHAVPKDTRVTAWRVGAKGGRAVYAALCCPGSSSRSASPSSSRSASPSLSSSRSASPSSSRSVSPSSSPSPSRSSSSSVLSSISSVVSSVVSSPGSSLTPSSAASLSSSSGSISSSASARSVSSGSMSSSSSSPVKVPSFCGCDSMPGSIGITFATIACAPGISGQSFTLTWDGSKYYFTNGNVTIDFPPCSMTVVSDNCTFPVSSIAIVCLPEYAGGTGTVTRDFPTEPGCACGPGAFVDFTLY